MTAEFKRMALPPSASLAGKTGAAELRAGRGASAEAAPDSRRELAGKVRRTVRAFAISTALVGVALICTILVRGVLPYPFLYLFFAAVGAYYVVPPFDKFWMTSTDAEYFSVFGICVLVASWVSSRKKKTEEALTE